MNLFGETIDMIEVFRFFGITPFEMVPYLPALNKLVDKGLIIKKKSRRRSEDAMRRYNFHIPAEIVDALMNKKPFPKRKQEKLGFLQSTRIMRHRPTGLTNKSSQGRKP
mgnify:CR=1 FL=1